MRDFIRVGNLEVEIEFKSIKHIHLSVNPPKGHVRISAPLKTNTEALTSFVASRIGWIRSQQKKMQEQPRAEPLEYISKESHYVWGKRYLLEVEEHDAPPHVELRFNTIVLRVRPGTSTEKRAEILDEWYRGLIKEASPAIMQKIAPALGVTLPRFRVQKMKTRWGSFCAKTNSIRVNSELAKKPPECLEYIVAHEMAHQLEHRHNAEFKEILDRIVPQWELYKDVLKRLPLRSEEWGRQDSENRGEP